MRYLPFAFLIVVGSAWADDDSISENGIDSAVTGLDGSGIALGTSEAGRSGKAGYDTDADKHASNTTPAGVYVGTMSGMDSPNSFAVFEHATLVASTMIGTDEGCAACIGVAPGANLHSLAIVDIFNDVDAALSLNRLATLSADVKAINLERVTKPYL
jgi:hypothetical protein